MCTAAVQQTVQLPRQPSTGPRGVGHQRQALARPVLDHAQDTEAPSAERDGNTMARQALVISATPASDSSAVILAASTPVTQLTKAPTILAIEPKISKVSMIKTPSSNQRESITIVSNQRLNGSVNGSSAYLLSIVRSLIEAGFDVDLLQPNPNVFGRIPIVIRHNEMKIFRRHRIRQALQIGNFWISFSPSIWWHALSGSFRKLFRSLGATFDWTADRPRPYSVGEDWSSSSHSFISNLIDNEARAIISDYIFCTPAFENKAPEQKSAIIMHDLFHSRIGNGKDSVSHISRSDEISLLKRAETVFCIQSDELNFIKSEAPEIKALLVPMPAEVAAKASLGQSGNVLFVGSNTAPNVVGLRWFLDEIWPKIIARNANLSLDVVGSVSRGFEGESITGVQFHGLVPDLRAYYERAAVVISPLTFGSGLKIKLVEALSLGKCTVVTPITLQGIEDICSHALICTDHVERFALEVIRLASSEHERLIYCDRARECAAAHFATETAHAELRRWAKHVLD